jgi:hypothetical protein
MRHKYACQAESPGDFGFSSEFFWVNDKHFFAEAVDERTRTDDGL